MRETWVQTLGREDPLEKEMATHSSILAWEVPWTEEPGKLQFIGSQKSGNNNKHIVFALYKIVQADHSFQYIFS